MSTIQRVLMDNDGLTLVASLSHSLDTPGKYSTLVRGTQDQSIGGWYVKEVGLSAITAHPADTMVGFTKTILDEMGSSWFTISKDIPDLDGILLDLVQDVDLRQLENKT